MRPFWEPGWWPLRPVAIPIAAALTHPGRPAGEEFEGETQVTRDAAGYKMMVDPGGGFSAMILYAPAEVAEHEFQFPLQLEGINLDIPKLVSASSPRPDHAADPDRPFQHVGPNHRGLRVWLQPLIAAIGLEPRLTLSQKSIDFGSKVVLKKVRRPLAPGGWHRVPQPFQ